jgi:hypothetical protein
MRAPGEAAQRVWVPRLSARCVSQRSEDGLLGVTHDHGIDLL